MSGAGVDNFLQQDSPSSVSALSNGVLAHSYGVEQQRSSGGTPVVDTSARPRHTPRKSLIVVLPDNHVVSAHVVTSRLGSDDGVDKVDVIVACAGQPTNLGMLQRLVHDMRLLLAPAGTSTEDLREFAMKRDEGDIVTLLSGSPAESEEG